jgi:hypothetical protein
MEFGETVRLQLKSGLPFVTISIRYAGHELVVKDVLVDTGSASTIFAVDKLAKIAIAPEPDDKLYVIRGVGGSEVVFSRVIEELRIGEHWIEQFEIEVGGMDYGFEINGILGMDFLVGIGAIINLKDFQLDFG